jgi:hypothetical protein
VKLLSVSGHGSNSETLHLGKLATRSPEVVGQNAMSNGAEAYHPRNLSARFGIWGCAVERSRAAPDLTPQTVMDRHIGGLHHRRVVGRGLGASRGAVRLGSSTAASQHATRTKDDVRRSDLYA